MPRSRRSSSTRATSARCERPRRPRACADRSTGCCSTPGSCIRPRSASAHRTATSSCSRRTRSGITRSPESCCRRWRRHPVALSGSEACRRRSARTTPSTRSSSTGTRRGAPTCSPRSRRACWDSRPTGGCGRRGLPVSSVVAHPGYSTSGRTTGIRGVNEPSRTTRFVDNLQAAFTQSKEHGAWPLVRALVDPVGRGRLVRRAALRHARCAARRQALSRRAQRRDRRAHLGGVRGSDPNAVAVREGGEGPQALRPGPLHGVAAQSCAAARAHLRVQARRVRR